MQQNEAYKQIPYSRETRVYVGTTIEIPEQAVQLNLAHGLQCERGAGIETEETGDEYMRMYAGNQHAMSVRPNMMGPERC